MITIVIVTKSPAPYRIRFYQEVARSLRSRGWQVVLLVATGKASDHPWADPSGKNSDLRIVCVGAQTPGAPGGPLKSQRFTLPTSSLFKTIRELNPSIIWTHEYSPFCLGAAFWARKNDKHLILSTDLGDNPPPHSCSRLQHLGHRLVSGLYHSVIAQTAEATRRSHPEAGSIFFAPHAISTSEYYPEPGCGSRGFRFLFAGRLDHSKGIERVVLACRLLASSGLLFELRVLGSGELAEWVQEQTDSWLSFGGFVEGEALQREYRRASAYVLPTRGDTYGVTVHEAAASGLPLIIGRNAGAVETLVKEGESGFAVDADDVQQISSCMRFMVMNPLCAARMGTAARDLALQYDVALLGESAADFIEALPRL